MYRKRVEPTCLTYEKHLLSAMNPPFQVAPMAFSPLPCSDPTFGKENGSEIRTCPVFPRLPSGTSYRVISLLVT